jgi:cation:H+ antiporter
MYCVAKLSQNNKVEENDKTEKSNFWQSIFMISIWILWLYIGGELIVNNAVFIAEWFGVSDILIWATIIALWTSLPELTASVIAARNKQTDMALWNIIWSNIFNIFWILWASSLISNITFDPLLRFDSIYLLVVSVIVFIFAYTSKKISKVEWIFLLLLYIVYIVYIVIRG